MEKGENRLVGIDKNWVFDAFIGVIIAIGIYVLSMFIPSIGTIGIPNVQSIAGTTGRFVIIVIAAPVFESIFFQDFVLDFFDRKLFNLPFFVAVLISSILFASFHWVAYGSSLSAAGGSFLSAFLVGMVFCYIRRQTNSILAVITCHMVLNLIVGFISYSVAFG